MHHLPEPVALFLIHVLVVGLGLPVVQALPPEEANVWLGWCVFPFVMLPTLGIFLVRFDRIERAYPYFVAMSVVSILLVVGYKLIVAAVP
jgi:hypothetical protein